MNTPQPQQFDKAGIPVIDDKEYRARSGKFFPGGTERERTNLALDDVRDGKRAAPVLNADLKAALDAEKDALEKVDEARAAREAALSTQQEWGSMAHSFSLLCKECSHVEEIIQLSKAHIQKRKADFLSFIGEPTYTNSSFGVAQEIATMIASIPILEECLAAKTAARAKSRKAVLAWGEKNGVPKDALDRYREP